MILRGDRASRKRPSRHRVHRGSDEGPTYRAGGQPLADTRVLLSISGPIIPFVTTCPQPVKHEGEINGRAHAIGAQYGE